MAKAIVKTGQIHFAVNGERMRAKGSFTYNLGQPIKKKILGSDKVHGTKILPQVPFIEGKITDGSDIDLATLMAATGTVTLELSNGKTIAVYNAEYASEGTVDTDEGEIPVRYEGDEGKEIKQ